MALKGVRVLEIAGLAPAPFAGMILADFGAEVIRIDRSDAFNPDNLSRGKKSIGINLKNPEGINLFLSLVQSADVLIEPFRPGVMENLGLGPEVLCQKNPKLIYARLTGFGQTGKYSKMAGHDINYIAVSGALSFLGRADENPMFPSNLLGDFAGGGMLCAMGILLALFERNTSQKGQVVDSAMNDGAAYLSSFIFNMKNSSLWENPRGKNLLDSGAHFYETYKTKDNRYMAVGAIEKQFYKELLKGLGIEKDKSLPQQMDQSQWPQMKEKFSQIFKTKTLEEWCKIFDGTDACVTPILEFEELQIHQHPKDRKIITPVGDGFEVSPAPKLSRTPGQCEGSRPDVGQHTEEILKQLGFSDSKIQELLKQGIVSKL